MRFLAVIVSVLLLPAFQALAHPLPDIPVRSFFHSDGTAVVRVEVDPRALTEDPLNAQYITKSEFDKMKPAEKEALKTKTEAYIEKTVEFYFKPLKISPEFEYLFTSHNTNALEKPVDPVMIQAEWKTTVPEGIEGYQIKAIDGGELAVEFLNFIDGEAMERINVLFPGETSFLLDLSDLKTMVPSPTGVKKVGFKATTGDRWATLGEFIRQGFLHVVPMGLDHILFVVGLFLLSREFKPLLLQVSVFTLSHTITLGLATLGLVSVSGAVVEPIIAASIAYVAIENIFRRKYTHWRLLVVFIFGLIHGLGFAGALSELDLPPASLVIGLLGFNVGVEFGQLAVIAIAFVATLWAKGDEDVKYRKWVVVPVSTAIAILGIYWAVERVVSKEPAEDMEVEVSRVVVE